MIDLFYRHFTESCLVNIYTYSQYQDIYKKKTLKYTKYFVCDIILFYFTFKLCQGYALGMRVI